MAATSNCSSPPSSSRSLNNIPFLDDHDQYQNIRGVLPTRSSENYSIIGDNYNSLEEVAEALQQAGLESSNLIVGIDFTKSNEWTGARCFGRKNLHFLGQDLNPYEQAISIIGRTLSTFDEDNLIPCYGFGDSSTHDKDVFSFFPEDKPCRGFEELLSRYRELVPQINLSGDGPWDLMQKFDDFIPSRAFDNCQFMNFTKIMVKDIPISYKETEFALEALMEIPSQYKATMELQLLGRSRGRGSSEPRKVPLAPLINYNIPAPSSSPNNEFMMRSSSMNMKQQQRATAFKFSRSSSAIFSQYNMVITFSHFFLESKNSNIALRAAFHLNPSYQPSRSSTVLSLSKKNQLKVKVNTVLGSNAPSLIVKLVRASKSGSKDGSVIESQVAI
uniref:Copine C-terminal domain-containing protein n=1 Tax=Cannabis sativa TaxID=3483 RepID=A0A803NL46_CANSA